MNHTPSQTQAFFNSLKSSWSQKSSSSTQKAFGQGSLEALLFPSFISLESAQRESKGISIQIGAQNAHFEKSGAFTGEVSAPMLQELGIKWALVGHSERRQFFGETSESAGKRCLGLLTQNMKVMLCVGELKSERESGQTKKVLEAQLSHGLPQGIEPYLDGRLVLAYEPVWAIGTGLTASPEQAEEAHQIIRRWLWDRYGMESSGRTRILYGGSVTPENCDSLLKCPNVDGALVGGASLKHESFLTLIESGGKSAL